jgi:hypothetical protein
VKYGPVYARRRTIVDDGRDGTITCRTAGNGGWFAMKERNPFRVGWYTCDFEGCHWSCFAPSIRHAVAAHRRLRGSNDWANHGDAP